MAETKSRFATEDDYSFFNDGTFSKILIRFNCLFEGKWNQRAPVLADGVQEAFKELIEIKQCSLYYRGTWLTIKMKSEHSKYKWNEQSGILDKFCKDYGFDSRKELSFVFGYDLPWPEGQKQREEEDDRTDSFFDLMDD